MYHQIRKFCFFSPWIFFAVAILIQGPASCRTSGPETHQNCGRSCPMAAAAKLEQQLDEEVERSGGTGPPAGATAQVEAFNAFNWQLGAAAEAKPCVVAKAETAQAQGKVTVVLTANLTPESFRENALKVLQAEMEKWHGPSQYLQAHYHNPEEQEKFKAALDAHFPSRPELVYHDSAVLPGTTDLHIALKLSDLGFGKASTTKPNPFLHTCRQLLDEYLTNTVMTQNDPLLLCQGEKQGSPTQFWATYVKGSARACTMLFLASQVIERQWDLTCLAPDLQRSLTAIYARRAVMTTDMQSVALANAKFSQQGGIRKAHCVLTWVGKLSLLQQNGLNAEAVLKTWNSQATDAGALGGNKRVAVLNALKMPSDCVQLLIDHLSEFGDKSAFYEDAFSNKKLAVGAKARSGNRLWNDRLTVSEAGLTMMLQYVHERHRKKLPGTHDKVKKDALESALNMAQLLVSLAAEMVAQNPIPQGEIDNKARKCVIN